MVFKTILIIVIVAILMEDGSSIKKSPEEEREDQEILAAVNATLAKEEAEREKEKKKKEDGTQKKGTEDVTKDEEKKDVEGKDKACPPANTSCPIVEPCQPCQNCEICEDCPRCGPCPKERPCPEIDCHPCKECGPCPVVKPCQPCKECGQCPVANHTVEPPTVDACPEPAEASMSTAVAMAIGACTSLLITGVATLVGLLLRYVPPTISGFLILATIIIIWYLCSHHPETARQLGGRAATLLREAAAALSHRIVEAIRHHNVQVGFPIFLIILL
jgi:hypothetical protein